MTETDVVSLSIACVALLVAVWCLGYVMGAGEYTRQAADRAEAALKRLLKGGKP